MPERYSAQLVSVARLLCEARGIDSDSMVVINGSATAATRRRPAWVVAADELVAARLLARHVEMLVGLEQPTEVNLFGDGVARPTGAT